MCKIPQNMPQTSNSLLLSTNYVVAMGLKKCLSMLAGVTPEMNLRNPLHAGNKLYK